MKTEIEKEFPYVKFRQMKRIATKDKPKGVETPSDWFLNLSGTHNQVQAIINFSKEKNKIVGYGNLEKPKFADVRVYVQNILGEGMDPRLLEEAPAKPMAEKIENAKK